MISIKLKYNSKGSRNINKHQSTQNFKIYPILNDHFLFRFYEIHFNIIFVEFSSYHFCRDVANKCYER